MLIALLAANEMVLPIKIGKYRKKGDITQFTELQGLMRCHSLDEFEVLTCSVPRSGYRMAISQPDIASISRRTSKHTRLPPQYSPEFQRASEWAIPSTEVDESGAPTSASDA
jgi:hypothetical protein